MSLEELGQQIKAKYPEYADIPDKELGARTLKKYPEYKDIANKPAQPKGKVMAVDMPPKKPSGAGRSFDRTQKTIAEAMGGTAGSILGGPRGAAFGGAAGNIYGQMLGQDSYPPIMVGGTMVPGRGEAVDIDMTEAAKEGAVQGAMDLVGGQAYKLARKPFAFAKETLKPGAEKVAQSFRDKFGGALTYAEQSKSYLGDLFQNISEAGALSGETMRKFHEVKQAIPLKEGLKSVARELVGDPRTMDEAGGLLQDSLMGGKKLKMAAMSKAWKQMDEFVGQPAVDINKTVMPLLEEIVEKAPSTGSKSANTAKRMIKYFNSEYPDGLIPWERAHIEQSNLFDVPTGTKQLLSSVDKANNTRIRGALLKSMGESAKNVGDKAFELWKSIRKQYGTEMAPYNARFIKQLANAEGGVNVMSKVLNQKSPSMINKLRALVPEEKWKEVQAAWLEERANNLVSKEGLFDLKGFVKSIDKMGESYSATFSGSQKKAIDELIKAIEFIGETGSAGKAGGIFIQMKQSSAISQLAGGLVLGGAAGFGTGDVGTGVATGGLILGGPWVIAKIITDPTATRLLTRTIKTPTGKAVDVFMKYISKFSAREVGSVAVDEPTRPQ